MECFNTSVFLFLFSLFHKAIISNNYRISVPNTGKPKKNKKPKQNSNNTVFILGCCVTLKQMAATKTVKKKRKSELCPVTWRQ